MTRKITMLAMALVAASVMIPIGAFATQIYTQSTGSTSNDSIYYVNSGWQRQFVGQQFNSGHPLIETTISEVKLDLLKSGTPNDVYTLAVVDLSNNVTNLQNIAISNVTSTFTEFTFNSFEPFILHHGDKVGVYSDGVSGSGSSDYVRVAFTSSDVDGNSNRYQIHDTDTGSIIGDLKFEITYVGLPTTEELQNQITILNGTVIQQGQQITDLQNQITLLNATNQSQQQEIDHLYTIWEQIRDTIINWLAGRP